MYFYTLYKDDQYTFINLDFNSHFFRFSLNKKVLFTLEIFRRKLHFGDNIRCFRPFTRRSFTSESVFRIRSTVDLRLSGLTWDPVLSSEFSAQVRVICWAKISQLSGIYLFWADYFIFHSTNFRSIADPL